MICHPSQFHPQWCSPVKSSPLADIQLGAGFFEPKAINECVVEMSQKKTVSATQVVLAWSWTNDFITETLIRLTNPLRS